MELENPNPEDLSALEILTKQNAQLRADLASARRELSDTIEAKNRMEDALLALKKNRKDDPYVVHIIEQALSRQKEGNHGNIG